jgi:hypothetical protein
VWLLSELLDSFFDSFEEMIHVVVHFKIRTSDELNPNSLDFFLPNRIVPHFLFGTMSCTVHFDCDLQLGDVEINYVRTDAVLPQHSLTKKFSVLELNLQQHLGFGHVLSESSPLFLL